MEITVIIPTYKRPDYLCKAIQSVLDQTYIHFELWIYDNHSQDQTKQVVRNFMEKDRRVHYFCHEKNIGMLKNYEFSISKVTTPFFCYLSDDDLLLPNYFESILKGFDLFPDIAFSAGSTILIHQDKRKVVSVPLHFWAKEGYFPPKEGVLEIIGKYPVPTSIIFRKSVLDHVKIDSENSLFWDCDFLLQIAAKFPFFISKIPCALFRIHDHSYSNSREYLESKTGFNRLIERIKNSSYLTETEKGKIEVLISKDLNLWSLGFFYQNFVRKRFSEALHLGHILQMQSAHTAKSLLVYQMLKKLENHHFFLKVFYCGVKILKFLLKQDKKDRILQKQYKHYIQLLSS